MRMTMLMMANGEGKPIFHDFLGMSCTESAAVLVKCLAGETRVTEASPSPSIGASSGGGRGLVSATSDLGSERQAGNNFESFQFRGAKSEFSGSGTVISNRFSGRKRSSSDSVFTGSNRDRTLQMGPDSLENSRLIKMFQNESGGEQPRRSHEDELSFAMQPPRLASTSHLIPQPASSSRHDLAVSGWERPMHMNVGQMVHYPSRLGQLATYVDKGSSDKHRDISACTSVTSQPAADEGSRTGIKGSSILNVINSNTGDTERNPIGALPNSNRLKAVSQNTEADLANSPSRRSLTSTSRQMTIFYAGQAHVFDDVQPNKADAIMALAGSDGGSWSTSYTPKSSAQPSPAEACAPTGENEIAVDKVAFSQDAHGRLSLLGAPRHGFTHGSRHSNPGGNQGSRPVREARTAAPVAEPGTEGKKEV